MAALRCFSEHGVETASIGEICVRSGASVGSVYHRFGNKEGIVQALLADGMRDNMEHLRARLHDSKTARDGIRTLIESLIAWVTVHPDWARFIYANLGLSGHAGADPVRRVNKEYARLIERYFSPHIQAGAFRTLPRECWASLVLGPVHDYTRRWLNGQVESPPDEHSELFVSTAWSAVRNPRRR